MKRFCAHLILALSPLLIGWSVELFILPVDAFNFRAWEALNVRYARMVFPGPFYPDARMSRPEQGDLGHHTPYSVTRHNTWIIDHQGFRNTPNPEGPIDVLVIGDSAVVGGGLDQKELLTEHLKDATGLRVVPDAPGAPNDGFQDPRFVTPAPPVVVFVKTERHLQKFEPPSDQPVRRWISGADTPAVRWFAYVGDRFLKQTMIRFLQARVNNIYNPGPDAFRLGERWLLFREGRSADRGIDEARVEDVASSLAAYREAFAKRGSRFIFVPVPNKETIHFEFIPGQERPLFLEAVIRRCREKGVETLDTLTILENRKKDTGELLFQADDSHWNGTATELTAAGLAEMIGGRKQER